MLKRHIALILLLIYPLFAQESSELNTFMKEHRSLRASSMGNAYTAIAEGPGSIFFNPAGVSIPGRIINAEHYDINSIDSSEYTTRQAYMSPIAFSWKKQITKTEKTHRLFTVAYGKQGTKGVDWGINYKSFTSTDSSIGNGWTSDLGLLVRFTPQLQFGILIQDAFKKRLTTPTTFRSGFALSTRSKSFILSTDFVQSKQTKKSNIYVHQGMEWLVSDDFKLRAGYFQGNITGGLSLMVNKLGIKSVDYGVIAPNNNEKESKYMFSFNFGRGLASHSMLSKYSVFKPDSYAYFSIDKTLVNGKSEASLMGGKKIGTNDLIQLISHASNDKTCKGFLIRISTMSSSLTSIATIQEIRSELDKAKKAGKNIIVYLENMATLPEYYLASIGNKIIMPKLGSIANLGLELEIIKNKEFLENFGTEYTIISSGSFKSSLLPFSKELTNENKAHLSQLITTLHNQVIQDIKSSRQLEEEKIKLLFDGRLISATDAKDIGLIDDVSYWDKEQFLQQEKSKKKIPSYGLWQYYIPPAPLSIFSPFNKIAIIEVDGHITSGTKQSDFIKGVKLTGSEAIVRHLKRIKKDPRIRGVILRVNSSGGSILASDEIYNGIKEFKTSGKKIYSSFGDIATSGGYFVSLSTDKIFANKSTLTGSIGVLSIYKNIEGLHDILGIKRDVIKSGKYSDLTSSTKSLNEEEKAILTNHQEFFHNTFINYLIENRGLSYQEAYELSQGQLILGHDAQQLNLIDEIGNFNDTIEALARDINIKNPELIYFRPQIPNLRQLLPFNI